MRSVKVLSFLHGSVAVGLVALLALTANGCGSDQGNQSAGGKAGAGGAGGDGGGIGGFGNNGGNGGFGNTAGSGGDNGSITPSDLCGPGVADCQQDNAGPGSDHPGDFPLPPDPNAGADGVSVDDMGWIGLDIQKKQSDYLWVADDVNYDVGFVSKISTKAFANAPFYREVARYVTVTCQSDPVAGNKEGIVLGKQPGALCADGVNGCCARDSSAGQSRAVNVLQNRPSRTAVDFSGDMWVANRAFGRQQSVTKIASEPERCIDRNANGKIDTSADLNSDGIITTDCNDDNAPDDGATTCVNGQSHEFYGLDDECILFTTNIGAPNEYGRALALSPSENTSFPPPPSDAWVGNWTTGVFYKVDGSTGKIVNTVPIQAQQGVVSNPYGAAIDRYGILWAPNAGGHQLFYFNTKDPTQQGMVQNGTGGGGFYGIAIDGFTAPGATTQTQQIWMGEIGNAGAYRYRPIRDQGFAGLGAGTWAHVAFQGGGTASQGRGIGVDNRQPVSFAWVALDGYASGTQGAIGRIPVDVPDNTTVLMSPMSVFSTEQGGTLGAGVASNLDIWGINQTNSSASHFKVDAAGNIMGPPDQVPLDDKPNSPESFCGAGQCKPHPYTYSDFTGFGLVNFTNPKGYYSLIVNPCTEKQKARWYAVEWDSSVPPGTEISMVARSADTVAELQMAKFTGQYFSSPADLLKSPGPLDPNPSKYIEVQFVLSTTTDVSPKLKGFGVAFVCENDVPQ